MERNLSREAAGARLVALSDATTPLRVLVVLLAAAPAPLKVRSSVIVLELVVPNHKVHALPDFLHPMLGVGVAVALHVEDARLAAPRQVHQLEHVRPVERVPVHSFARSHALHLDRPFQLLSVPSPIRQPVLQSCTLNAR